MEKSGLLSIIILLFSILFFISIVSADVFINEAEINPLGTDTGNEWVELYNNNLIKNLTGWYIQDRDGKNYSIFGVIDKFFVLDNLTGLDNTNQNLSLFNKLNILQDNTKVFSDNSNNDNTWSRVPDGTGNFTFQDSTKGIINIKTIIKNKSISSNCIFEYDNVTLNVQVTGFCIENVIFSIFINNTWKNYTGTNIGGSDYSFIIDSTLLSGEETIDWTVFTFDCFNITEQDGIESFYVRKKTSLSTFPVSSDGLNSWYITEPIFTLTKDAVGGNIHYQWDSTGTLLYISPFGLEDIPNNPPLESAGILELNWWANFGVCGNELKQTKIFYVDLKNPLISNLEPENNSFVFNNLRPEISAYLDEVYQSNSGINLSSVIMKLDNIKVNSSIKVADTLDAIVTYTPASDLSEGLHKVYVYIEDKAGRNSTLTWPFTITNLTPTFDLIVYSPQNLVYDLKIIPFNISLSQEVKKIEYINYNDKIANWRKLCNNCGEYGYKKKMTKTGNEGLNNIIIKATDSFENSKEQNVSFIIDSEKPKISQILPQRNAVINGSEFLIKYAEENLQNIALFYGNEPNTESTIKYNCEAGRNKECIFSINLSDYGGQEIEFWFEITDLVNSVESRKTKVKVDNFSPILSVFSPVTLAGNETYGKKVQFNITVSEEVTLEYIDYFDSMPRWKSLCMNCDEYGSVRKKTKNFQRGIHNIIIRALDNAGNSDTEEVNFNIDY